MFIKNGDKIIFIVLIVVIPMIALFSCVNLIVYDLNHYKTLYLRFNISEEIGLEKEELIKATTNLLDYLKDNRDNLDFKAVVQNDEVEFFSNKDKLHMIDVKNIFITINRLKYFLIAILLVIIIIVTTIKSLRPDIGKVLIFSTILGTLPFLLLIFLILMDFNKYFTIFHEVFFDNDLWLLDPKSDRLVNIFPEKFFAYSALKILIYYFIFMAFLFVLGFVIKRNCKKISELF
ncbi:MAG: TIGR01906 family membrane protein [Firmicutes bacterium]|nr:TIGR01906 family membrane protein [Bacillota bacterium]